MKKYKTSNDRRVEIKYDITDYPTSLIINKLSLKEIFRERAINSLYYDTLDFEYYRLSHEGIVPRKKVRIRYYKKKELFLEIKKQDFLSKFKILEKLKDYRDINKSLNKLGIFEKLIPVIQVSYNRRYFQSNFGRITIDSDISFNKFNCDSSIYFSRQRKSIQKILEIKNQNLGEFGLMSFSKLNLKNIRNSKYCIGIEEIFSNELKNGNF